ncbi:HAD-IA family hydrolase [Roseisolibacter sp. H3M3-2]|uniref:HAD-IA family hydrolase n=1 Tax=Roseisolibacter sp. H3M3-2 TaxID=3031323 RepID=UPI0023DCE393|nr:HAD-IA family hydrolase [Roseisolibacter sp. H3M3-2]MDF1504603.1 HAD-IA family hydrolase [Roseisolibacter sp. H3M3-2]
MLSALIFDLDGTLVDTNAAHVEAWVSALARHGYRFHPDRIAPEIGKGGDNLVPDVLGKEAEARDGEALREASKAEYLRLAEGRRFRVFDGAAELLDELRRRGIRTALATSSGDEHLDATFGSAGVDLRERVDVVVGKSDVARSKPYPDAVLAAVEKLGLSPAECAMVGDTPYDALSAKRAGVIGLGVLSSGLGLEARDLVQAGARRVWRDVAHLRAELDDALRAASPGPARLTVGALETLMREALAAAEEGMAAGEAPIGCAIADGAGRVLARAYNRMNATQDKTAHAEVEAFRALAGRVPLDARDLVMASTLEPCVMCTGAAMESAVDTIVYALQAPADSGTSRVRPPESPESQMPRIVGGVLAAESRALFERWMEAHRGEPQAAYVEQLLARTPDVPADPFDAARATSDALAERAGR